MRIVEFLITKFCFSIYHKIFFSMCISHSLFTIHINHFSDKNAISSLFSTRIWHRARWENEKTNFHESLISRAHYSFRRINRLLRKETNLIRLKLRIEAQILTRWLMRCYHRRCEWMSKINDVIWWNVLARIVTSKRNKYRSWSREMNLNSDHTNVNWTHEIAMTLYSHVDIIVMLECYSKQLLETQLTYIFKLIRSQMSSFDWWCFKQ